MKNNVSSASSKQHIARLKKKGYHARSQPDGKPIIKKFSAKTRKEVERKLRDFKKTQSSQKTVSSVHFSVTPEELDVLENGLNINNSDVDLFEFEGKTHIYYASGDQMTYSFLCEAVYGGPPEAFLEAFFKTAD